MLLQPRCFIRTAGLRADMVIAGRFAGSAGWKKSGIIV